jgi:hypothetical protein
MSGYQTSVANAHQRPFVLWSLPDVFPQTRIEVPDDHAVQVDSMDDKALGFVTGTPQSRELIVTTTRVIYHD